MQDKEEHEIQLDPTPGFVIKTLIAGSELKSRKLGTKVFINVCWDRRVPQPPPETTTDWTIPVVVSASEQHCLDKAGRSSLVWDCCINLNVLKAALESTDIRAHLIETCLGVVEDAFHIQLSRDHIATPKLRQKGELQKTLLTSSMLDQFVSHPHDGKDEGEKSTPPPIPLIKEISGKDTLNTYTPKPEQAPQDTSMGLKPISTVRYQTDLKNRDTATTTSSCSAKDVHLTKLGSTADYSYQIDVTFENTSRGSNASLKVEADDDNLYISDRESHRQVCQQPIRIPRDATQRNRKNLPIRALYVTPESQLSIFI